MSQIAKINCNVASRVWLFRAFNKYVGGVWLNMIKGVCGNLVMDEPADGTISKKYGGTRLGLA